MGDTVIVPAAEPPSMDEEVQAFFDEVPERHRETVEAARALVLKCHPDAEETLKWNQPTYVVGGENRFYLAHYAEHVNLGFHEGASVDDPDGLLSGTGKAMRHVKLASPDDLDDPDLRALVERAA